MKTNFFCFILSILITAGVCEASSISWQLAYGTWILTWGLGAAVSVFHYYVYCQYPEQHFIIGFLAIAVRSGFTVIICTVLLALNYKYKEAILMILLTTYLIGLFAEIYRLYLDSL